MTPAATRGLRRVLLGLVAVVSVAVIVSLRRPPGGPAATKPPAGTPASGTTMGGVVLRKFVEGSEKYVVRAKAMTGEEQGKMHLVGVEVTFPYVSQGKATTATVTAEKCLYDPNRQRAAFRGQVKVKGEDGFFLEAETLDYEGDQGHARTDDHVSFRRGAVSGESRGAEYRTEDEALDLPADVFLRIERDGVPPTEVRSGQAALRRRESAIRFSEGVRVTRGTEYLEAQQLRLEMSADFGKIDRAIAIEHVTARAEAAATGKVAPAGGREGETGARILRCRRLDAWFRENGELRDVTAVKNADLEIRPGGAGTPEVRRVSAHHLTFRFDEAGRLVILEGGPNGLLSAVPVSGSGMAGTRTIKTDSFTLRFDPEKGDVAAADFSSQVEFVEPGRRAWAQTAALDETKGTLVLSGSPRLVDEGRGSDLRAETIEIGTHNQNLAARENVRHLLRLRNGPGGRPAGEPSVFLARFLDYDAAAKTARYRENALLRSGTDELRGPLIVVEEPAPGRRRLTATGGIVSLMHPRRKPEATRPPEPVEVHAAEMVWEEAKNEIVYEGDVVVKQGDIESQSPLATVTFGADGGTVERVVAGEPVEVKQGLRRASGSRGTYTPSEETMVLVGDRVVLQDPEQRTEGRSLTFRSRDDTIRVDGREEVRTESVFKRELPKH